MTNNQLLKALQKLEAVYLSFWSSSSFHSNIFKNQELLQNIVTSEWLHWYKDKLSKPDFKNHAGSYQDCYEAEVSLEGEHVQVELVVYEGDNITGDRRERRCKFVFHFKPEELPKVIVDCVEREAVKYARKKVEEQLEQ